MSFLTNTLVSKNDRREKMKQFDRSKDRWFRKSIAPSLGSFSSRKQSFANKKAANTSQAVDTLIKKY